MKKNKITIKQIFEDNYPEFWKKNKEKYPEKMREHMNIEVMKILDVPHRHCVFTIPAEYRILSYDGKNVTFWYTSHETNDRVEETVTAQVYAGSISVKVRKCFGLLQYIKSGLKTIQFTLKTNWKKEIRKMTYRELMIINFSKDPRKCLKCGQQMELWQIWYRKYGYIYDMGTY